MSKAAKQIILILVVLLGVSAFFALSLSSKNTVLEQEKATLTAEITKHMEREKQQLEANKELERKFQDASSKQDALQKRVSDLQGEIQVLSKERDDWKSRVDNLRKEQEGLLAQLREAQERQPVEVVRQPLPEERRAPVTPVAEAPQAEMSDEYWAAILKEKAGLELRLAELERELIAGAVEVQELKKKNSDLELEIGHLKNVTEEFERKIKYNDDLANTLSIELAREKNDKRYVSQRSESLREENLALRAQVKELSAAKIGLEKSIVRLRDDKEKIERSLAETESIIQNRIDEVLDIKRVLDQRLGTTGVQDSAGIELPPIIVSAQSASPAVAGGALGAGAGGHNGRIVSINKENNFVIVDLGENSGVKAGDMLSVYRGDAYIAGLEVIQVRKDISAADIKQESARIRVGDIVR